MNDENTKKLYDTFPELFQEDYKRRNPWGFACDDGWFNIIYELSEKLQEYRSRTGIDIYVIDVKEKFGELICYLDHYPEEYILSLIRQARQQSLSTCEICGKKGTKSIHCSLIKTLCQRCAKELGFIETDQYSPLLLFFSIVEYQDGQTEITSIR